MGRPPPERRPFPLSKSRERAPTQRRRKTSCSFTSRAPSASRAIYRLPSDSRIDDAIRAAGGPKPRAALSLVNLAAPVADGQQVLVQVEQRSGESSGTAVAPGSPPPQVRLNSATLEELDSLPGVGPVTAQKILDYRAEHGAFASIDELDAVPGIGPARMEQLRELLTL